MESNKLFSRIKGLNMVYRRYTANNSSVFLFGRRAINVWLHLTLINWRMINV